MAKINTPRGWQRYVGIDKSESKVQNSGIIYDLMGRRVKKPTKGMYIVGERKVVIK